MLIAASIQQTPPCVVTPDVPVHQRTALAAIQLGHNLIIAIQPPTHLYLSLHYTAMDLSVLSWNSQVNEGLIGEACM